MFKDTDSHNINPRPEDKLPNGTTLQQTRFDCASNAMSGQLVGFVGCDARNWCCSHVSMLPLASSSPSEPLRGIGALPAIDEHSNPRPKMISASVLTPVRIRSKPSSDEDPSLFTRPASAFREDTLTKTPQNAGESATVQLPSTTIILHSPELYDPT
ncbi:hypothetical protein H072_7121 [Dactylellina haptotyla CBS 200.50]|uniref:Uncharacterized protein n=1 Tax=Dactylellina haptotyla (strain CBS 200.50) TaxID=1284197 RepID=S8A8B9_DACHA|nr:hypothetical protein H072_7121 [Dactylellina haptotyla CBS 200.50]